MKTVFDSELVIRALGLLDQKLQESKKGPIRLLIGGGGALIAAYGFSGATTDIDAVVLGGELSEIENEIREVQKQLSLPGDWINPHYSSFTIYLPPDYGSRATDLYNGQAIIANALGREDLLVMKFMAGRGKDIPHIRHLIKQGVDLEIVENRLDELKRLFPDLANQALDLFDEITEEMD